MKLGRRLPGRDERVRTAIGSMVNGTIGGQSKRGMPVVERTRVPLVAEPVAPPYFWVAADGTETWTTGSFNDSPVDYLTLVEDSIPDVLRYNAGSSLGNGDLYRIRAEGQFLIEVHFESSVTGAGNQELQLRGFTDSFGTTTTLGTATGAGGSVLDITETWDTTGLLSPDGAHGGELNVIVQTRIVNDFGLAGTVLPASYLRISEA